MVYKDVSPILKRYIAVKMLNKVESHGLKEFKTEVNSIRRESWLLVNEYMSNGSLATLLFGISIPH